MKRRSKGLKGKYQKQKMLKEDAFLLEEEKWKDNFWKVKSFDIHLDIDSDRDGVIDRRDCQPFNPNKQDVPTRPTIEKPTLAPMGVSAISSITALSKPTYVSKSVGIDRVVNAPIIPNTPASVPNIPKSQQSVLRTIYPPNKAIDVPQSARMQVERATTIPSPRNKPTSPEIKKLIDESRALHLLPFLPNETLGTGMTSFKGQNLFLVTKFGEQFWADDKGNIIYRTG